MTARPAIQAVPKMNPNIRSSPGLARSFSRQPATCGPNIKAQVRRTLRSVEPKAPERGSGQTAEKNEAEKHCHGAPETLGKSRFLSKIDERRVFFDGSERGFLRRFDTFEREAKRVGAQRRCRRP